MEPVTDVHLASGDGARALESELLGAGTTSVWRKVWIRALAFAIVLAGLATVGAVAMARGPSVPSGYDHAVQAGSSWIKPVPSTPKRTQRAAITLHDVPAPPTGVTADGKVILNEATAEELTRLPSVGMKRATAIVRLRKRLKRFRRVTSLLRIRGIGVRTLKKIRPHLVLDRPKPNKGDRVRNNTEK